MYLTRAAVKATLDAVHAASADGSQLAHDMWFLVDEPGPLGSARRAAPGALSLIGEPVTFGVHPEDYEALLRRHGFAVIDVQDKRLVAVAHRDTDAEPSASRRNNETVSREIRLLEMIRAPSGRRSLSSGLTASDVETITGIPLVC